MGLRSWFRSKVASLADTYPEQKADVVTSYDVSQLWGTIGGQRYNPDDLVGQKGLTIYSRMLNDEQVKSVTEFKLNAILGRGYQFKFHRTELSDQEQQQRIAVFEESLRKMRGSFVDALEGIASGREFGFSITEKVYGEIEVDGKTYVGINMLLTRDPCSFDFYADEYGILNKIEQRANGQQTIKINRDKVIHYVHKPKWDLIFGRSELRSAYRSWYAKDQLVKMWLMHLEKFGSGIAVATPEGDGAPAYGSPEHTKLQDAMKNFKALTSIILPKGIKAEVVFPASTDQFQRALEYFDLAIAKSQLVPNLLGLSHTGGTGAYAQSQTQLEAFFWTTGADGARLSECLNEELFRDLGDQNWGDGEYPYFCFKPISMEHMKWMIETWIKLMQAGAVITTEEDERILRQMLEMGERNSDAKPVTDPMAERQQTHTEEQAQIANDQRQQELDQRADEAANKPTKAEYSAPPISVTVHNPAPSSPATSTDPHVSDAGSEGGRVVPHGKLRSSTLEQFTRASMRVNFSVIEKRTDDYAVAAVDNLASIVARATKRALGDDANMAQLTDEDPTDVAAIDLNGADRGKLKGEYKDILMRAWTLGSDLAANEMDRARGERTPLSTRKAKFVSLRDNATAYFETQSFRMAGDTSDQVRKLIQQELQNGIKFGKTTTEIRVAIWERLLDRGMTTGTSVKATETANEVLSALDDLGLTSIEDVPAYLNTLVRTNTFEALNEARFAEFTDPAVGDFVQALEYAAVLDSSTTEICRELNGKVYRADSPEWDEFRPPNHFNCRSVLVPVTTIDGWDGQESAPPSVEPAEGFK